MTAMAIARRAAGGKTDKDRLTYKSNARDPARMSRGATKPYVGGEELRKPVTSQPENKEEDDRSWFKPIGNFAGGGGARPAPAMDNFKGIPGGIGGLGGGPAGQALSVARRMGSIPQGADPRPGYGQGTSGMQEGGHAQQTHESGSAIRSAYEDKMAALLPPSAQKGRATASGKEGEGIDSKALREISKLMEPGLPNPFEELQGQAPPLEHGYSSLFPGQTRVASTPESLSSARTPEQAQMREQPLSDPSIAWIRTLLRAGLKSLYPAAAIGEEIASGDQVARQRNPQLLDERGQWAKMAPDQPSFTQQLFRPMGEHLEHHSSPHAIRAGRVGAKKGGVAKKALALAKRKRKGSKKRSK